MTATIQVATLTAKIATLSITGLDILDFPTIPEQVDCRAKAQLFPDPELFVTELVISDMTHGYNNAGKNANYKLNYVLAFKQIEAGRRFNEYIPDMVDMTMTIVETITTTDLSAYGGYGISTITVPFMGKIIDPAGNMFLGARILIDVLEIIQ
jgi:hypothetical protein